MVLFGGQLSRNIAMATIFPKTDLGSAAPFSVHRTMSMIVRPSRSLRPFHFGVLVELNCCMIVVVLQ